MYMGGNVCTIVSATTTSLQCVTPAAKGFGRRLAVDSHLGPALPAASVGRGLATGSDAVDAVMFLIVNGDFTAVCADGSCGFQYNASFTPEIVSAELGVGGTALTVVGSGFTADPASDNTVTVGGVDCSVTSATSTELACTLGSALSVAGSYLVSVNVAGNGDAQLAVNSTVSDVTVAIAATVTGIDVASGSYGGGLSVTLSGTGFNSEATDNSVTICGEPCPVTAASPTSVTCAVPSALQPTPLGNSGRAIVA